MDSCAETPRNRPSNWLILTVFAHCSSPCYYLVSGAPPPLPTCLTAAGSSIYITQLAVIRFFRNFNGPRFFLVPEQTSSLVRQCVIRRAVGVRQAHRRLCCYRVRGETGEGSSSTLFDIYCWT